MEIKFHDSQIVEKKALTNDVFSFKLNRPENFNFLAGQFIQLQIPVSDGSSVLRSYSIASTPAEKNLELCIKLIPGGAAGTFLSGAQIGDAVKISSPRGAFSPKASTPGVFIATGVGIAPIMGLIKDELINKQNSNKLQLLFGLRFESDVFWQSDFQFLESSYKNFRHTITLSKTDSKTNKIFSRGRVTEHLEEINYEADTHYWICGSLEMVKEVRAKLISRNVPAAKIHFEVF